MKKLVTDKESEAAWALVAADVLKGKWKRATASEIEALVIGMRGFAKEPFLVAVGKIDPKGQYLVKVEEVE